MRKDFHVDKGSVPGRLSYAPGMAIGVASIMRSAMIPCRYCRAPALAELLRPNLRNRLPILVKSPLQVLLVAADAANVLNLSPLKPLEIRFTRRSWSCLVVTFC